MGRKLLTDGQMVTPLPQPGTDSAWDVKDHSLLMDEDKFAPNEENSVSTSLAAE